MQFGGGAELSRSREVWDTISLFHSGGRPSNTDVIKPPSQIMPLHIR